MTSPPPDWFQFYQTDLIGQGSTTTFGSSQLSDATVVSTTISSPTTPTSHLQTTGASSGPSSPHLNPEGRVSKPIRRRSRASRRTPTTLLNTDTTNFRAMVQQFTGGPPAAFPPSPGLNILGSNSTARFQNPGSGNYHIDFRQTSQLPHHLQFPRQQQQYVFPGNYGNNPEDGFNNNQIAVSSTSSSTENNKNNNNTGSFIF
ncbi:hypothetical protein Ancab_002857 [Ancistrocladus abbreviatus]